MLRLLLLEDKSAFAERLATTLSADGLAQCERSSLHAFEKTAATAPDWPHDAIVLDWRRNRDHQLDVCRRVAQIAADLPIVAITATEDVDQAVRIIKAGAEDVCLLSEPENELLLDRIRLAAARFQVHTLAPLEASVIGVAGSTGGSPGTGNSSVRNAHGPAWSARRGTAQRVRLLQVFLNGCRDSTAATLWAGDLGTPVEMASVNGMDEAMRCIEESPRSAILIHASEPAGEILSGVEKFREADDGGVILVSIGKTGMEFAVEAIQRGADDCLDADLADPETHQRCLRLSLARRQRLTQRDAPGDPNSTCPPLPQLKPSARHELQRKPRYYITKSAVVIPVRPNLMPDKSVQAEGFTVDISESGIGFEISGLDALPSELLLAGIEGDDGLLYFATVEVCNWTPVPGRMKVGARFVEPEKDILRDENLKPRFQPEIHDFATGLPTDVLTQWAQLGVLRPVVVDRIYVCPKCQSLSTFRSGCRSCGSIHIASHQLIHHFDCSYLGTLNEFEQDGHVICPKCGKQELEAAVDFERLDGPYHCLDCSWSDTDTEVVGKCLSCRWHFPLKQASERELIGFDVHRLDAQTLLGVF